MKSLMETLSKQVEAFETQQKSYDEKLKSTQRDIQVTRRELRRLTAQAAADHATEVTEPIMEEDEQARQYRRCGGGCLAQPSPRPAGKVLEHGRQVQSGGDQLGRREHGYQHRKRQQKAPIGRTTWLLCQVMLEQRWCLSSEGPSGAQMHVQSKDAGNHVEAYDCQWGQLCSKPGLQLQGLGPLHPRTFNQDHCVQPFMALHNAHILAMQCGTFAQNHVKTLMICP